jgi:hypothetical protein
LDFHIFFIWISGIRQKKTNKSFCLDFRYFYLDILFLTLNHLFPWLLLSTTFKYLYFPKGCYDVTLPRTPIVAKKYINNACVNFSQISCLSYNENFFYSNESLVGTCYNNCPDECTSVSYDLTVSSCSFPTLWYSQVLANNSKFKSLINAYFAERKIAPINYTNNFNELRNSIAVANVFYEDLSYSQVDDNPAMTFVTFLGTLGGNMGLLTGEISLYFY